MSVSTMLHNVTGFIVSDLYPHTPGSCITLKATDGQSATLDLFLDDKTLRMLAIEMQRYATSREAPPIEPKPTYAQALFASVEPDPYKPPF